MASRKPAIERPENIIDDIGKAAAKKIASRAFKKGQKAFSKMEKIGGVTYNIKPGQSSPKSVIRKWEKASNTYNKSSSTFNKYYKKSRGR